MPSRPGNHLQQLAMQQTKYLQLWKEVAEHMHKIILIILHMFSATSWTLNLRFKIECSIATSFTKTARVNITSCDKPFESSPKKSKEEHAHERGSDEPKDGNYQSTTVSSEHRLSLANNCQRTRGKKTQTLVSWLKNYSYSLKFNWPKRVSVDQVIWKS